MRRFSSKILPQGGLLLLLSLMLLAGDMQVARAATATGSNQQDMLPPTGCSAGVRGILGWDMNEPLSCMMGVTVDEYGNVAAAGSGSFDSNGHYVGGNISAAGFVRVGTALGAECNSSNVGALRYSMSTTEAEKEAGQPGNTIQYCAMKVVDSKIIYVWQSLMPICNIVGEVPAQCAAVNFFCSASGPMGVFWCMNYVNTVNGYNNRKQAFINQGRCDDAQAQHNAMIDYIKNCGWPSGSGATATCTTSGGASVPSGYMWEEYKNVNGTDADGKIIVEKKLFYCGCKANGVVECEQAN